MSKNNCYYCGAKFSATDKRFKKTKDHKVPRSRGGNSDPANIVDACFSCNQAKGTLTEDEFLIVLAHRRMREAKRIALQQPLRFDGQMTGIPALGITPLHERFSLVTDINLEDCAMLYEMGIEAL